MHKIIIKPQWMLQYESTLRPLPKLLALLAAIEDERTLAGACRKLGLSYRHAWGLLQDFSRAFGRPIVEFRRGEGTRLAPLGAKLLWADRRISARLSPLLEGLAAELAAELQRELPAADSVLHIHTSHGFAIETLHQFLVGQHVPVALKYCGSMQALDALSRSQCALAGFHAPIGELQPLVLQYYRKWLKPQTQTLIHLATRCQGIMVQPGNPRAIRALADLSQPGLRFANRQLGSGTRILFGLLLKRDGLDSRTIAGHQSGELTHTGVAASIASGMADAGFGVEAAAHQFNLAFIPIVRERYFLICDNAALTSPVMEQVRATLASTSFKAVVGNLPGYDAAQSGTVTTIDEAFPDLENETAAPSASAIEGQEVSR